MEQQAKLERDRQAIKHKPVSRKVENRVSFFSGAKLKKSNDERDTALSKIGELKVDLNVSNGSIERYKEEIAALRNKLDKMTDQRDAALSHVGELKADLKATNDSEGEALEEAIDLRVERDMLLVQQDAALSKVKQLEAEVEGLKEVRIVASTTSAAPAARPTSKKRKIDAVVTRSIAANMLTVQESWVASVVDLNETLSAFNLNGVPKDKHNIMLGYLTSLFCLSQNCVELDPEGKGLNRAKRLRNLERYRLQVDEKYHPTKWHCFDEVIFGYTARKSMFVTQYRPCARCVERKEYFCVQVKNLGGTLWFRFIIIAR